MNILHEVQEYILDKMAHTTQKVKITSHQCDYNQPSHTIICI